jgi:hypothetical protein
MFFEIGLQLLLGFVGVQEELLPGAEGETAEIAIGHAGCGPDESYDPEISVRHRTIIAGRLGAVNLLGPGLGSVPGLWPPLSTHERGFWIPDR